MNDNVRMHLLCKLWVLLCAAKWVKIAVILSDTSQEEKQGGGGLENFFFIFWQEGKGNLKSVQVLVSPHAPAP